MHIPLPAFVVLFVLLGSALRAAPLYVLYIFVDDQAWSGTTVPMIPGDNQSQPRPDRKPQ